MALPFSVPSWPVLAMLWMASMAVCFSVPTGPRLTLRRGVLLTALATYLAAVAGLTMFPHYSAPGAPDGLTDMVNVVPLVGADPLTFGLNIVMTVPLGLLMPLVARIRSVWLMAAVGLVFSIGIESTQGVTDVIFDSGRVVDVNDLIANTAGAVVGWFVLASLVRRGVTARVERPAADVEVRTELDRVGGRAGSR